MAKIDGGSGFESVHKIKGAEGLYEVRAAQQDIAYLERREKSLQQKAIVTGNWKYYQELLFVQESLRCRKEILEKYPYDGKSSFSELVAEEVEKKDDMQESVDKRMGDT